MSATKAKPAKPLTYGPTLGPCRVCNGPGARACSGCRVDFYCGKQHQKEDWPRHKQGCGAIELRVNEKLGRHLVATKDVPAGTVLMRELPLATVTSPRPPLEALCVGCCRVLWRRDAGRCARCGWPVCGAACSLLAQHRPECVVLQRAGFKLHKDGCWGDERVWFSLAALRICLAAREPPNGPRLLDLQSELPKLAEDAYGPYTQGIAARNEKCEVRFQRAAEWLIDTAGVRDFSRTELVRAMWAQSLNSFALDREVNGIAYQATLLFGGFSLMEHACLPNCYQKEWMDLVTGEPVAPGEAVKCQYVLVAGRDIRRGENLSASYSGETPLRGSHSRRMLLSKWGIVCECALCRDPTQAGLHLDAWYCSLCKEKGKKRLVTQYGKRWACGEHGMDCGRAEADRLETLMVSPYMGLKMEKSLSKWENILSEALWPRGLLHPTNHAVLTAKEAIANLQPRSTDMSGDIARIAVHCRDLLSAVDALCPGHVDLRGPFVKRLFELGLQRLVMEGDLVKQQPSGWPQRRAEVQALLAEMKAWKAELHKSMHCPDDMMCMFQFINSFNYVSQRFPLPRG